jgi:hypothetical protein
LINSLGGPLGPVRSLRLATSSVFVVVSRPGATAGKKYNRLVAHTDIVASQVPEGDFILSKRPTRWLIWRSLGKGASRTTWNFSDEESALAQALAFAQRDKTGVWLKVSEHQFRLIQNFRP